MAGATGLAGATARFRSVRSNVPSSLLMVCITPVTRLLTCSGTAIIEWGHEPGGPVRIAVETLIGLCLWNDGGGVVFRHPTGDALSFWDTYLLDVIPLLPQGSFELQFPIGGVKQHQTAGFGFSQVAGRMCGTFDDRFQIMVRVDQAAISIRVAGACR